MSEKILMLISRVVGVILFFGAIIGALLPALYRGSGDEIYQYVLDTVPSLANDELIINKDPYDTRQDFITVQKLDNEAFKILQLSDIHINCSVLTVDLDKKAIDAVVNAVKNTMPDLIVLTGDFLFPNIHRSWSINNENMAKVIGTLFDRLGIPWTFVYGNHDAAGLGTWSKDQLSKYFLSFESCLFKKGQSNIDGQGNFVIELFDGDGIMDSALVMMDSHGYGGSYYDHIHANQVDWYSEAIGIVTQHNGGIVVPSHLFCHIPLQEYVDAWDSVVQLELGVGDSGITDDTKIVHYYWGTRGERSWVSSAQVNDLYDILKKSGTVAVYCGHDHLNNFSIEYDGIRLTYGMSIDYTAYIGISTKTAQRGATLITINPDGTHIVQQVPEDNGWKVLDWQK